MEFLVVESSAQKKPCAVVGCMDGICDVMSRNKLVKRTLMHIMKDSFLDYESRDEFEIVLKRVYKTDDGYLQQVRYRLEPPLKVKILGSTTVRDFKYGLEKVWKEFVGELPK